MLKYDEEAIKQKLKMECGCSDVPDLELWKHKVILGSPVKGDDTMSLNAAEYVAKGLEEWKNSIAQVNEEMADKDFGQEYNLKPIEVKQLEAPKAEVQRNFRIFDVGHGLDHFVVGINMDQEDSEINVQILQSNFTYIKERAVEDLTAFDRPLSYYQWYTWMSRLDRPVSTGVFDMQDFDKKLNFTFEGLDDQGLEQAKKFI